MPLGQYFFTFEFYKVTKIENRRLQRKLPAPLHHAPDEGREDQLHGQFHFAAGHDDGVGAAHVAAVDHRQQVRKINALGVGKADDDHAFVGAGYVFGDEGVGGVYDWHALEIDVGA